MMRLHYNARCAHNDLPATRLRLLYNAGRYADATQEIARLKAQPLDSSQLLVAATHEVLIKLVLRRTTYAHARERFAGLARQVADLGDMYWVAEFRSRCLTIAGKYGDYALADSLTNGFFADIVRDTITEAHWRLGQGRSYAYQKGPAAAIPFHLTVVTALRDADRPCLHEMAARHLAFCLRALGDKDGAVEELRSVGLPASCNPRAEEVALEELLTIPVL